MTSKLNSLESLFERELQDLYSAENQLTTSLPEMKDAATDESLRKAIDNYRGETVSHIERLKKAFVELAVKPVGVKCLGTEGLINEYKNLMDEEADPKVLDCALIAILRRIQHHQIAGYGIARTFADQLGHHGVAEMLRESLTEQEVAEKDVAAIGVRWVNVVAAQV